MLLSRLHLANVNVSSTATRSSQTRRWWRDGNGIDGDNPTQNSTCHISCFHTNLLACSLTCRHKIPMRTLMLMLNRYEFVVSRDSILSKCAHSFMHSYQLRTSTTTLLKAIQINYSEMLSVSKP